ncbi:CidA/LrgA family protein [Legionella longbeachae]|uniref:Predicted membrane protein n=1 Tax=Legionella longbeachae serogroup 1 (strain NSW150) TaxID=661367 RepID=D3HMK1_LEGLN|nr:CidA/LrgA family protein [Legionella longbeachae]VEE04111.1 holin-like protein [Legionella oakridgensis]HBD7396967.1 CidA/LrgA family protein [Legionella pneumophila]ARB93047.1 CidA/LrgA family protein [Legionella longbeachae]ARM33891.1 CidA/LrgA family protein [Legionella longbeachae]EEZ96915.1 putative LrgA family murein hydrolase exporter [Legionella longbeachae D-4968]
MTAAIRQNSLFQVLLVLIFWFASDLVVKLIKLPVSGGVLGLGIVLLLLVTKHLQLDSIRFGAQLLLADMLLFFIPAVLAVLEHQEFAGLLGLKIFFVIVLSTLSVMLITALVVDYCYRWRKSHANPHIL